MRQKSLMSMLWTLDMRTKLLGAGHPVISMGPMGNLATTYRNQNQGMLNEAEKLQIQVMGSDGQGFCL